MADFSRVVHSDYENELDGQTHELRVLLAIVRHINTHRKLVTRGS